MELSKLSIKCLENMPMITGTMVTAVNELHHALSPYYGDYWGFLNEKIVSDKQGGFKIRNGVTGFVEDFKKSLPLTTINMSMTWEIFLDQNKKTNPKNFGIYFGCDMYENQNILYFQLFETSDTSLVKELLKNNRFIKSKNASPDYQYKNYEEEKDVWVEFTIDETLSSEKIKTCSELFKTNILIPILDQLK